MSGPPGDPDTVVTAAFLEARAGECDSLLDRYENEAKGELRDAKARLEAHEENELTLGALLEKWRKKTSGNPVTKALWWLLKDHLKTTIVTLLLAATAAIVVSLRGR